MSPFVIDESSVETMQNCLTFTVGPQCASNRHFNFIVQFQQVTDNCEFVRSSDFNLTEITLSETTCAPVFHSADLSSPLCYRATLTYNGVAIDTQTNLNFDSCPLSIFDSILAEGVMYQVDDEVTGGNVSHLTTVSLYCDGSFVTVSGAANIMCVDGQWDNTAIRWCSTSCTGIVFNASVLDYILLAIYIYIYIYIYVYNYIYIYIYI